MVGDWALCHATHKIVAAGRPEYTPDLPRDACAKTSCVPQKARNRKNLCFKIEKIRFVDIVLMITLSHY